MLIYGINNSINIIPFWIKNEVFIKILINILILLIFITYEKKNIFQVKQNIEVKLQRYIKHKRTNKIANYYNYEKKLKN